MAAKYVGAHMSTSKGLGSAIREARKMGCTAVQVFTSSPRQWKSQPPTLEKIKDLRKAVEETGIDRIVSHDTYLVNICHADPEVAGKSRTTLQEEMVRCGALGIPHVVSHIGALGTQTFEEIVPRTAETIRQILGETPDNVTLCMETTAGQGTSINSRFEEIGRILDECGAPPRLAVCLDTCHVFVAGYDIRTRENYETAMLLFDHQVGLDRLQVLHLNDSKKGCGSHVDRHEHIGKGQLGPDPFGFILNDPRLENVPMVIETEQEGHAEDLATLRALAR
jgi:deoxyribonuclease-4